MNKLNVRPLILIIIVSIVVFTAIILLLVTKLVDSQTLVGFLGILIGAGISSGTSVLLERENRKFQLATAALDKRLEVHQQAYAIWRKILSSIHQKNKIGDVVIEAEEWWQNHCLYLDAVSRQSFHNCLMFAFTHKDLLQGPRTVEVTKLVKESWEEIMKPGETLVKGVALPSLGNDEKPMDISAA